MKSLNVIFDFLLFLFLFLIRLFSFILTFSAENVINTKDSKESNNVFVLYVKRDRIEKLVSKLLTLFGLTMIFSMSGLEATNSPEVNLSCSPTSKAEGDSGVSDIQCSVSITVAPDSKELVVNILTGNDNDTAESGSDYNSFNRSFSFTKDTSIFSYDFNVSIIGDTMYEQDETFEITATVSAQNPQTFLPTSGTLSQSITITDDDSIPSFSVVNVSQNEGNSGGNTDMIFTATLTNPSSASASVNYVTANGTAVGTDFTAQSESLFFASGETTKTFSVPIFGDTTLEPDEYFTVNFDTASNLTIATASATGTILNDDTDVPNITISDQAIAEGDSGTTNMIFTVTVTNMKTDDVTVSYVTQDGSAFQPSDYNTASGSVIFTQGGSDKQTITIPVVGDTTPELNEQFYVILSNPTAGAVISDDTATGTITNDDNSGTCSPYIGQMTINEYNFSPSMKDEFGNLIPGIGNFLELKVLGQVLKDKIIDSYDENTKRFTFINDWTVEIYNQENSPNEADGDKYLWERDLDCDFISTGYLIYEFSSTIMTEGQATLVVRDAQDRLVDIFYYGNNEIMYQQSPPPCTFVYDTNMTESTSQNKDVFRLPDGTGEWSDYGTGANSGTTRCLNSGEGFSGIRTIFDAFDYKASVTDADIGRPITTKVADKDIALTAISTNSDHTQLANSIKVGAWLARKSGNDYYLVEALEELEFKNHSSITMDIFTRSSAGKDHVIAFKYCEDDSGVFLDWDGCWLGGISANRRLGISWDNFAIRPKAFDLNITNTTPSFVAEKPINLRFLAINEDGTQDGRTYLNSDLIPRTDEYNETQDSSFLINLNITGTCAISNLIITPSVSFENGEHNDTFTFNDVGSVNMSIYEKPGAEYALEDADDTSDIQRYITPYNVNFTVIPDHFSVSGDFKDHHKDSPDQNFTYLSDFSKNAARNAKMMASEYNLTITAEKNDSTRAENYTSGCFAKDLNITIIYDTLNADGTSVDLSTTDLSKVQYYEKNIDTGDTYHDVNIGTDINYSFSPAIFDEDINGTALVRININLDRNYYTALNPFIFKLNDINTIDTDDVNSTLDIDQNVTYLSARAKSSEYFYDDETSSPVSTPISVVVYCDLGLIECSTYGIDGTNGETNEYEWYLSTRHDTAVSDDGNITLEALISGSSVTPADPTPVTITVRGINNNVIVSGMPPEDVDITFGSNTNNWMIYNPNDDSIPDPFYHIHFIGTYGWAGHGDTGNVVGNDASSKKNRRLGW